MNETIYYSSRAQQDSGNIISTKLPYTPTFEDVFPNVRWLLIHTNQAVEEAVPKAKEFFTASGKAVDKYLFNDLVRYYAKCRLQNYGFSVEDDEKEIADYQFKALANNGLSGSFNGYPFRILKADRGDLPLPGPSERKQKFYHQQLCLPFDIALDEHTRTTRLNLLVLWEVDVYYNFTQLRLACPKAGGNTRESVEAYFNQPIPHAAEIVARRTTAGGVTRGPEEIQITKKESKTAPEHIYDLR